MRTIHTMIPAADRCSVSPDCPRIPMIRLNRSADGDDPFDICTLHYHKLVRALREQGGDEDTVARMSNEQIRAMVTGGEFARIIADKIADAKFKGIIRKRVKRKGKGLER